MKEPRLKEVVTMVERLAGEDSEQRAAAAGFLDALPRGWSEDHSLPRTRVAPLISRLARVLVVDPNPTVKQQCAQIIAEVPVAGPDVVQALRLSLTHPKTETVLSAVYALGTLRKDASMAVPDLILAAAHPSIEVRWRVAWALDRLEASGAPVVDAVRPLMVEDDPIARGYGVRAFARAANGEPLLLDELLPLLSDHDPFVRAEAQRGRAHARA